MDRIIVNSNFADALTGERIGPGEECIDTGIPRKTHPYQSAGKTLILKESTIVWLAEELGLTSKRNAGDSGNAKVVDTEDVGVGGGEVETGGTEAGGGETPKRRSNGKASS